MLKGSGVAPWQTKLRSIREALTSLTRSSEGSQTKKLPFYKMYPADAEVDENFRLMSLEARGLYWTLLNHAWINDGLPESLDDIRELVRLSQKDFDRLWVRVSRCFESVDGRHRNRRQEVERFDVRTKSESATKSVRTRYERSPNVGRHAIARALTSDSDSDSVSESEEEEEEEEEKEKTMIDGIFEELYAAHPKKSGKVLAMHALAEACTGVDDPVAYCRMIQAKHREWLPEFLREGGKFAPQLHRWISEQKYLDDAPAPIEEEYDWRKAARG
jgi:uncharacterized protein YdaU (DUF1376 family)